MDCSFPGTYNSRLVSGVKSLSAVHKSCPTVWNNLKKTRPRIWCVLVTGWGYALGWIYARAFIPRSGGLPSPIIVTNHKPYPWKIYPKSLSRRLVCLAPKLTWPPKSQKVSLQPPTSILPTVVHTRTICAKGNQHMPKHTLA